MLTVNSYRKAKKVRSAGKVMIYKFFKYKIAFQKALRYNFNVLDRISLTKLLIANTKTSAVLTGSIE